MLNKLSDELKNELARQLHRLYLVQHPFFQLLDDELTQTMVLICSTALKEILYADGEIIFGVAELAEWMYVLKSGESEYTRMGGDVLELAPQPRETIGEAVLWTSWVHRGSLRALTPTTMLCLDPDKFCEAVFVDQRPWFIAVDYGGRFLDFLNQLDNDLFLDIIRDTTFFADTVGNYKSRSKQ